MREALAELQAARFSPPAIARFLRASGLRAQETRQARPALARQALTWSAAGALAWVIPAIAGLGPFRTRLPAGLAGWAVTALMLDWHLGMFESEAGEPRPLGPADACTLTRAWLVPLAAQRPGPLVCAIGLASDGLDGAFARASVPTRAGRDLEGLVDTVFALASLRGGVRCGGLGRLAATAESGRLLAGIGIGIAAYFGSGERPDPSLSRAARASTPIRAGGLIAAGLGHRRTANTVVAVGTLAAVLAGLHTSAGVPVAQAPAGDSRRR